MVYENQNDKDYIVDNGSRLLLVNASSGVQSVLPLYQTVVYVLANLYARQRVLSPSKEQVKKELNAWLNALRLEAETNGKDNRPVLNEHQGILATIFNSLNTGEIKKTNKPLSLSTEELLNNFAVSSRRLSELFEYHYTQLFIEEPEQNLFPDTQQELIYWILANLSNEGRNHAAVITTHSPYVLFALNNCMMGGLVGKNIPEEERKTFPSHAAWIDPKHVSIYELEDGEIRCIQDEDGILEDNYLNKAYKKNSDEYLSLLNYYDNEE